MSCDQWRVYKDGKDTGIVETNLFWATQYWRDKEKIPTGRLKTPEGIKFIYPKYELVKIVD